MDYGFAPNFDLGSLFSKQLITLGYGTNLAIKILTPIATCRETIEYMQSIGVDEIACLIDFGLDFDSVMTSLYKLQKLTEEHQAKNTVKHKSALNLFG